VSRALVLALLVAGCTAASEPHTFRLDDFNDNETALIRDAAAEWTEHGYPLAIDPTCPRDVCSTIRKVDRIDGQPPSVAGLCSAGGHDCQMALNTPAVIDIQIRSDVGTPKACAGYPANPPLCCGKDCSVFFREIVLHELGHAVGKNHIGPGNIMYFQAGPQQADALTEDDLK